jgi:hypothetical protein
LSWERFGRLAELDRSVREQPMATLVFAAVVDFLICAIWKS